MKKVFCLVGVIITLSVATLFLMRRPLTNSILDSNIEALAQDESGKPAECFCKSKWFSPDVCSSQGDGRYCGSDNCSDYDGNCR